MISKLPPCVAVCRGCKVEFEDLYSAWFHGELGCKSGGYEIRPVVSDA